MNAVSATVSNVGARRIDHRTALLMIVGAVPAAVIGSMAVGNVSRDSFQAAFGVLLLVGDGYIIWRSTTANPGVDTLHEPNREIR